MQITFESNDGLEAVEDSDCLWEWAPAARGSGALILLHWASEMKDNWIPSTSQAGSLWGAVLFQ